MSTIQLRRDPFARMTLMHESHNGAYGPYRCHWCGQLRKTIFLYWWESDARPEQPHQLDGFCSVGCWEAYNS